MDMIRNICSNKKLSDLLFILWAGGAALLSYSLVYALRKPYTAASFEGLDFYGVDYKVAVTTIQVIGYLLSKFVGIKLISEMKRERRFRFFAAFVVMAEATLILFGLLPAPYNVLAMFFNGLSLGCMWGIIFSFIEGRRVTDMLASLLGVSIVFSSGMAKILGLFAMNDLHIDPFWMPAVIGGVALPLLLLMGYLLKVLPKPTAEDIALRSERVVLDGQGRKALFLKYCPILTLLFFGNLLLLMLRDIKEDFLVNILDMSGQSSWLFAQVDTVVTLVILSLYVAYLTFQTIFFDRFIACFRIKGNVGFFIAIIDFIGYMGTVTLLFSKELFFSADMEWFDFYNHLAAFVGIACFVIFSAAAILMFHTYKRQARREPAAEQAYPENDSLYPTI